MKTATIIAIVSMAIQTLASLYFLLLSLRVMDYDRSMNEIMQPFFFLSNVGLLIFFILLYQKQSKN